MSALRRHQKKDVGIFVAALVPLLDEGGDNEALFLFVGIVVNLDREIDGCAEAGSLQPLRVCKIVV